MRPRLVAAGLARRRRRVTVIAGAVAVGVAVLGGPSASAQTPPSDSEGYGHLIDGDTAEVGARYGRDAPEEAGGGSGGGDPIDCAFYVAGDGDITGVPVAEEDLRGLYDLQVAAGQEGVWIDGVCWYTETNEIRWADNFLWTPGDPLVPPDVLAEMAVEQLDMPEPNGGMSPSLDAGTYAQLDTYFWSSNWHSEGNPVSTSVSAGNLTVTAQAHTIEQRWAVSDDVRGETYTVTCTGPGLEWEATSGLTAPSGACTWDNPPHSSAGQAATDAQGRPCFPAVVTFVWHVEWSGSDGSGATLPNGATAADTCIFVDEIQALVTDG